jgi:hypothetical protein
MVSVGYFRCQVDVKGTENSSLGVVTKAKDNIFDLVKETVRRGKWRCSFLSLHMLRFRRIHYFKAGYSSEEDMFYTDEIMRQK